jgi:hypothetical protein
MLRLITILVCLLWATLIAAKAQVPDISNFEELGTMGGRAFSVNAKDAQGTYKEVKFLGLLADVLPNGYDPDNWIVTAFVASCETGEAIQKNSIGIVSGVKYEKEADPKATWRKPAKTSPLEKAIQFVCKKKFGEGI